MEECLVLNVRKTRMMQIVAEHESSRLEHQILLVLRNFRIMIRIVQYVLVLLRQPTDRVLSCLLIKFAIHEDVKEETDCCVVCQFITEVNCPEEWVGFRVIYVWETNQINSDMTNNTVLVKYFAD